MLSGKALGSERKRRGEKKRKKKRTTDGN